LRWTGIFAVTVGVILAAGRIINGKLDELNGKLALHAEATRILREIEGEEGGDTR
jgi:hypothetical protein